MEYAYRNLSVLFEMFIEPMNNYDVPQLIMLSEGAGAQTSNKLTSSSRAQPMYTVIMTNVARSGENRLQNILCLYRKG